MQVAMDNVASVRGDDDKNDPRDDVGRTVEDEEDDTMLLVLALLLVLLV